ncbi:MAG: hypothetical protein AAF565_05860, partial [Pseudomonadota bacterium]
MAGFEAAAGLPQVTSAALAERPERSAPGLAVTVSLRDVVILGSLHVSGVVPVDVTLDWRPLGDVVRDGGPDLFAALTWKHGLNDLIGRAPEMAALIGWAQDGDTGVSVRLMSGPAGVGKTRLAAEAAERLRGLGWTAGFLAREVRKARAFHAPGAGLFLILDYPEERRDVVDEILETLSDRSGAEGKPVRILLVSRKPAEEWEDTAALLGTLFSRQEIARPAPLPLAAASQVLTEAATRFAGLTGESLPDLGAAEAWLARAEIHRRPLFAAASGIRAVVTGSPAFDYGAADLMRDLARRERVRVEGISTRAGLGRHGLARLLALGILSRDGLDEDDLRALGAGDIAPLAGTALVDALRTTPWMTRPDGAGRYAPARLERLEPDQPAAAFFADVLLPETRLPDWLAVPAEGAGGEFGKILARLAFDLATLDPGASRAAEQAALEMLDRTPALAETLRPVATALATAFSARFAAAIATRLLATATEPADRAPLLGSLGNHLSATGRRDDALRATKEAADLYRTLARDDSERHGPGLATAVSNLANRLSEVGRREEALAAAEEAVALRRTLAAARPEAFTPDLAMSVSNLANHLSE